MSISIHALHEESDMSVQAFKLNKLMISIHALHEESDQPPPRPAGGLHISIHALHEESDRRHPQVLRQARYFNPRSP